jgi:predicted glycogen debranching enzyme
LIRKSLTKPNPKSAFRNPKFTMITVPKEICTDLDRALTKEWVVANGIGGYASSTVTGANTRRYHGLLVAALKPPVDRTVLLSKIDEEAIVGKQTFYLGTNEYPDGKVLPGGFEHIDAFSIQDGIPTTTFRLGKALLHKTVWMEHGHNTTYVRYTYEGRGPCQLVLHPLCNYRDYHDSTTGSPDHDFEVEELDTGCMVTARPGATPLWLTTSPEATFERTGAWLWNFVYRGEVERGYEDTDDLYAPGAFRVVLKRGQSITVVASTEPPEVTSHMAEAFEREQARARGLYRAAGLKRGDENGDAADPNAPIEAMVAQLVLAADSFIVQRKVSRGGDTIETPSVLAGYHWFTDWGRDTMISLLGLTLPTGRGREAGKVLQTFGIFARDGLIPNHFPDSGQAPHYNTADGTLWMFAATEALARGRGNITVARNLYPLLADIIAWHLRGTHYGIKVDPSDGLLMAGTEGVQLTWMDAKVEDWVVTPRQGKPVEINALWYNALRVMDSLRVSLGRTVVRGGKEELPDFHALANQVRESFRRRFWFDGGNYLFDVIDGPNGHDFSIRPNQVFAISLSNDLLTVDQQRSVLECVRKHLLTPYGLRTLSPEDPGYITNYVGNRRERDGAYHQGTVWPWLLGAYFDAVRNVEGAEAAAEELRSMLPALRSHLANAGLGSISEIFDADPPHAPKGTISQAWSVAELLRHIWGPNRLL